jgi:hypothetical protein
MLLGAEPPTQGGAAAGGAAAAGPGVDAVAVGPGVTGTGGTSATGAAGPGGGSAVPASEQPGAAVPWPWVIAGVGGGVGVVAAVTALVLDASLASTLQDARDGRGTIDDGYYTREAAFALAVGGAAIGLAVAVVATGWALFGDSGDSGAGGPARTEAAGPAPAAGAP